MNTKYKIRPIIALLYNLIYQYEKGAEKSSPPPFIAIRNPIKYRYLTEEYR